jgi:hypothetical protein
VLCAGAVADRFRITLTYQGKPAKGKRYSTVYYLDADLRSGKTLRKLLAEEQRPIAEPRLFVGIGHIGVFQKRRRRDFIPPSLKKGEALPGKSPYRGHADRFYLFLQEELLPLMENRYGADTVRTLVGHSFGGLFVCYSLLRTDRMFQRYCALSPSLWVNRRNIFAYEARLAAHTNQLPVFLYLSAGKKERLNRILPGVRRLNQRLRRRQYMGLHLGYAEHRGRAHHSQVPVSLKYLLEEGKF